MAELLSSQIRQNLRLALPEGLQDLMSDISREVLRAQPSDIPSFIMNYLAALLVTRENLTIASRICNDVCKSLSVQDLEDELKQIGVSSEDIVAITTIVFHQLSEALSGTATKEGHLMSKLMKNTSISSDQVPQIRDLIRQAFLKYQTHHDTTDESSSDENEDEVTRAAHHTLHLYRKTRPSETEYNVAATKIQAAYRAYSVRRKLGEKQMESHKGSPTRNITFEPEEELFYNPTGRNSPYSNETEKTEDVFVNGYRFGNLRTLSSTSLAGSFVTLPSYKPYNAHSDVLLEKDENETETCEKEHNTFDYMQEEQREQVFVTYRRDSIAESVDEEINEEDECGKELFNDIVSEYSEKDDSLDEDIEFDEERLVREIEPQTDEFTTEEQNQANDKTVD